MDKLGNVFGHAYYENGLLIRHLAGSLDSGVMADFGELQQKNNRFLPTQKWSTEKEFSRMRSTDFISKEGRIDQIGGRLVFEMASKFFDQPLDTARRTSNPDGLKMELITKNEIRPY